MSQQESASLHKLYELGIPRGLESRNCPSPWQEPRHWPLVMHSSLRQPHLAAEKGSMKIQVFLSSSRLNVITLFHLNPRSWTVLTVMCSAITPPTAHLSPICHLYKRTVPDPLGRSHGLLRVYKLFCWISDVPKWFVFIFYFFKIYLFTCYYFIYLLIYSCYLFILSQGVSFLPRSYLMCRGILSTLMCVYHVCAVPAKVRSSIRSSRN